MRGEKTRSAIVLEQGIRGEAAPPLPQKPRAKTMAGEPISSLRALSPVQGDRGQVVIAPGTFGTPAAARAKPAPVKTKYTTEEWTRCSIMHLAVVVAFGCLLRYRGRDERACFKSIWPEALAETTDDQARRAVKPLVPAEVSLMDLVIVELLKLARTDRLGQRLIIGRALGYKWTRLQAEDDQRRGERMLAYLRMSALVNLWGTIGPQAQSLLQTLQKF